MTDTPPNPTPPAPVPDEALAPAAVAGSQVLEAEAGTDDDDAPEGKFLEVRGRRFPLRNGLPGMLISRISRVGADAQKLAKLDVTNLTDAQTLKFAEASASTYDVFRRIIAPEAVDEFIEYVEDVEPPIEFDELGELLATGMETISGRPTKPSSSSDS